MTTVDLILVMRTVRAAVTYRRIRYAAAIVAGKAVGMTFLARTAGLSAIRCKMKQQHAVLSKLFIHFLNKNSQNAEEVLEIYI